jgi:hypothetical protein
MVLLKLPEIERVGRFIGNDVCRLRLDTSYHATVLCICNRLFFIPRISALHSPLYNSEAALILLFGQWSEIT